MSDREMQEARAREAIFHNDRRWRRTVTFGVAGAAIGMIAAIFVSVAGVIPVANGGDFLVTAAAFVFIGFLPAAAVAFHWGASEDSTRIDAALSERSDVDLAVSRVQAVLGPDDERSIEGRREEMNLALEELTQEVRKARLAGATKVEIETYVAHEIEKATDFAETDERVIAPLLDWLEGLRDSGASTNGV